MNDAKYFVPDIEDIRVNYECEILRAKGWEQYKIEDPCIIPNGIFTWIEVKHFVRFDRDLIRTSFLTKEQIETEGWQNEGIILFNCFTKNENKIVGEKFTKDQYSIYYHYENKLLCIIYQRENKEKVFIFDGECKSINEFRYICKLLKI